jgi:hypothetical protein
MRRPRTTARTFLVLVFAWVLTGTAHAAVPRIAFPVVGKTAYSDDFGAPRGSGSHQGNDIMARRKTPVVAAEGGKVVKWTSSARAGCMLYLYGRSGTTYLYIHLNNDRTMRNDTHDNSTCVNGIAYASGLKTGAHVRKGQLLGYVGDSGDADGMPHLHFELHPNDGRAVSPYKWLRAGYRLLFPRPRTTGELYARIRGTVVRVRRDLDPDRLRVRVTFVRLSNGQGVRPARGVTVTVPAAASVSRRSAGTVTATTLGGARIGERVTVRTVSFPQRFVYARAPVARHAADGVLLRG